MSLVELPRLKARFELKSSGNVSRLHSLDYDGWCVADRFDSGDPLVRAQAKGIPHGIVMRNESQQHALLVPNYSPSRPKIKACPFSTALQRGIIGSTSRTAGDHERGRTTPRETSTSHVSYEVPIRALSCGPMAAP